MMRIYLKMRIKQAVGCVMGRILPVFSDNTQARIRRTYMDWVIPAQVQQAMLLLHFCPTCRCRTCLQQRHCSRGCGDCKLSWANYQDMRAMEAAYTFGKCQRFKGGKENERKSIMELFRQ